MQEYSRPRLRTALFSDLSQLRRHRRSNFTTIPHVCDRHNIPTVLLSPSEHYTQLLTKSMEKLTGSHTSQSGDVVLICGVIVIC